ncbi:shikimate kinase [Brunnivagina elsteri]|uniref:Shikimate kinase n=1 Tax=Brunnivagina elsteri CCALA 953 TaxID=987040 RepID=A0A2A2TIF7_9CYAN|nr:shikimate kinase [Calothrix elsteri]PAX53540.1 shikimate kinase [Calothrix elsteri CCALA 953]
MNDILQGINVYLIGMMGAGKTTVGRLVAQHLQYGFLDTDEVITKAAGKSINEIFVSVGEAEFRQVESDILGQICAYTKLAIATGGGIIMRRENWGYLRHGLVVWLDVPVDLLCSRLAEDTTRPLLQDANPQEKLRSLLEQRIPLYSQADLHITISEDETPESIAQRIMDAIPSVLKQDNSQN